MQLTGIAGQHFRPRTCSTKARRQVRIHFDRDEATVRVQVGGDGPRDRPRAGADFHDDLGPGGVHVPRVLERQRRSGRLQGHRAPAMAQQLPHVPAKIGISEIAAASRPFQAACGGTGARRRPDFPLRHSRHSSDCPRHRSFSQARRHRRRLRHVEQGAFHLPRRARAMAPTRANRHLPTKGKPMHSTMTATWTSASTQARQRPPRAMPRRQRTRRF